MPNFTDFLAAAERAARTGGQILLDMQGRIRPREKGLRDLVTEADLASQAAIRDVLLGAFPDHEFVGEEDGTGYHPGASGRFRWIVDPLDGTTNYVHRLQTFAVSIALERDGEAILGLIYDPIANECYTAIDGGGAFLNGRPIRTGDCERLGDAMVAASLPPAVRRGSPEVEMFIEVLYESHSLRRLGSAALNLCYVAAGRLDAYWATSTKAWDVAAGALLVREAGGFVTGIDGQPFRLTDPRFVAACTPALHGDLLRVLRRKAEIP